jgi:hypothetical protein
MDQTQRWVGFNFMVRRVWIALNYSYLRLKNSLNVSTYHVGRLAIEDKVCFLPDLINIDDG